jgi:hypothetical protein
MTAVYLEIGKQRVFACALDWPGWCRSGKTEALALEALANYRPRYARAVAAAGLEIPDDDLEVVGRVKGAPTTDFGAPGAIPEQDQAPLTGKQASRLVDLVAAAWGTFDRVVRAAPAELEKGPRGGGRDRDKIVEHVLGAENAYARKIGVRMAQPVANNRATVLAAREAVLSALRGPRPEQPPNAKPWPSRYAARRIAWHVLDHAWEIEDRGHLPTADS